MAFDRTFNADRAGQGFKSQEHLDAFYRYFDHARSCAECQKPGKPAWIGDGLQPTQNQCDEGRRLYRLLNAF